MADKSVCRESGHRGMAAYNTEELVGPVASIIPRARPMSVRFPFAKRLQVQLGIRRFFTRDPAASQIAVDRLEAGREPLSTNQCAFPIDVCSSGGNKSRRLWPRTVAFSGVREFVKHQRLLARRAERLRTNQAIGQGTQGETSAMSKGVRFCLSQRLKNEGRRIAIFALSGRRKIWDVVESPAATPESNWC